MARGTARRGRGRGGRGGGRGRGGAAAAAVAAAAVSSVTQVPNGEAEIEQSRVVGEVEVSSQSDLVVESEVAVGVLEEEATKTLLVSAEVEEKMEYLNNNNNGMEGKALNLNSSTVVAFEDVFVLGNQERVDAVIIATEEEEEEELVSDFHEVQQGIQQQQQQQIATNSVPNEAGNMEEVELEAEEEKKNHELDESSIPASSKIEGALEQPLEQPLGQPDKEFVGGVADLIGDAIGEDKDGEDKNGEANDGGKDIGGEGGEFDAEAQHSLPVSERRKHKRLEVFVGGLDKDTTEEDLKRLFQQVGDVVEVRLMRNSQTGKNKGYAFIRYATTAMAKRAAEELQHIEINGRPCGVLPSEENDTLFLGNISKSWKKEMVLDALRDMGINNIEELTLMEDPQLEGVNRGFSFIEFSTHKEALKAFRRLQQTDATFGTDRSAKVAWAQPLNEPDEETMSQVKSVFVDGMPPAWDEEKVREHFGKFGEIDRIVLARNMSAAKRKDFGFVNYVEREAAMACIDAISNSGIVDGEIKIKMKVMLAKPQVKSKPAKGGVRGGYPLGFKGDHRVGSVPAQPGRGGGGGRGGMHDGMHDERRGYNSFRAAHGRGSLPTQSETYAERYDRVQGGRGYVGGGYGGRREYDYMVSGGGDIGGGGVGVGHSGRDHIPAALVYGGHDRPLHERYGGSVRDYEGPGIKRSYSAMEEEAKNFESQRGIPRARLEAPEPVPSQSVGVGQFGGATMYADASRFVRLQPCLLLVSKGASVGRLPDQQQYTPYAVPQAVSVGHGVGQPQYLPLQHVSSQQLSTQHVSSQHVSTQQASMSGMMVGGQQHMPSPQASIPGSSIGGQVEGGTPYSIYDAAPQPTVGLQTTAPQHQATHNFATGYAPTSYGYATGYTPATAYTTSAGYTLSQEYMGVAAALPAQEVNAATSYPTQSAYTAQYAVTPQQIPSAISGFTVPGAGQQTYY
ncbi:unnamed protein product [Sphagnum jensenii]|uniref:RRM domain-containing protein n=1 Tax=Sphagnum jensenii TaxID=128206 RepID=A0ABP0VYB7_9BRYO